MNPITSDLLPHVEPRMQHSHHKNHVSSETFGHIGPALSVKPSKDTQVSPKIGETIPSLFGQGLSPRHGLFSTSSCFKFLCSFGGRIMIRPGDGRLRYCGGETRIIALDRNLSYKEFILKMAEIYSTYTIIKYQLPGEDLDALVSVSSDEDLQNLIDEYDKLESNRSTTRLRLFLFDDLSQCEIVNCCITLGAVEDCSPEVQFYVDTINGIQERMFDMHLEEGMHVISPHHEKRTTKYGSFYSANPFAREISSAPSSPLISLRQAYHNPWGIVDTPFQASKEWTNAVSPEATRDIFVDTSSTLKCHQNQVFIKSPKLHQDMEFSSWEVNLNADDPEMHMAQQCEYHHGSSIVTDTWNDIKHSCSRMPPQYQPKNNKFSQASDKLYRGEPMQYRHLEMHKQGPIFHPPDREAALFHCHECYAPLEWTPDLDHQISSFHHPSPYLNVQDSHIQSVTSFYVDPSSSQDVCTTCSRHHESSQVHHRINGSTTDHKHNRILSPFGNQAIRRNGGLPFSSRLHDGVDHLLDDSSGQEQSNHVKGLEVDEHDRKVADFLEKKNVQYHLSECSAKEDAPDYAHNVLSEFALPQHEIQKEHCNFPDFHGKQVLEQKKHLHTDCEGHFEELTYQHQNVEAEVRNSCKTRKSSRPLQDHQRDVESVQNARNIISNSGNSRVLGTNQGDPLDHLILERVTFTLDDLPNVGHGISSFGSDSTSLSSIDHAVTMSRTTFQTQDLFDPIASASKDQLKRNADHVVYHKENMSHLPEKINTSNNDYFWSSMQTDEDNVDEEIDVRLSYSTTFRPINLFEDIDEKRAECLPVSSSAYKVAEIGRGCSSLDANASGRFIKEGVSDSVKGQHMISLSWPSGSLGWTNRNESSITFVSPVFDRSPTSSINSRNSLVQNSEESFLLDSANWIKENMSLGEELANEKVSSVLEFSNEREDGNIAEGEEDAIERHCKMIFKKGIGSASKESTSPLHSSREWNKEAGANANIWEKSIRHDQISGGLSSEVKESESDSFCFLKLKKKSSVIEAEAEATARGLQIIRNVDIEELRELGSGTYGTVFYGKWRGSDVAIKRIKSSCFIGCRPSVQERLISDFWSEAGTLSQLHHPNIVAFYGVVPDGPDGNLATVTEFMVNGSLKQVLVKKDRTIDRKKRLLIAMDTAFGMEYLHSKNVVHFDLKSENLLVNMRDSNRPVCKVGDFGLSKVKHHTLVSGGIRGTLPWMAPELLSEKHAMVTEKIDVYSFGIVMWELLTGEEPYANMHCGTIIGGIVNNTLRPLIPSWSDPSWKQLMERCWAADPADRPSFATISSELRSIAAKMNIK